jgi:hypothetical protein
MQVQMFDEIASEEINGAAAWVLVSHSDGRRTPLAVDHFGVTQEGSKWIVSVVPKAGPVFRHSKSHPSNDVASKWVEDAMKAYNVLEREIAARRLRQI